MAVDEFDALLARDVEGRVGLGRAVLVLVPSFAVGGRAVCVLVELTCSVVVIVFAMFRSLRRGSEYVVYVWGTLVTDSGHMVHRGSLVLSAMLVVCVAVGVVGG